MAGVKSVKDGYWTFEQVESIAKTCRTLQEFCKKNQYAYMKAYKKVWIEKFWWLEKEHGGKHTAVYQYTLEGVFLKKWNKISDAIESTGANNISCCCRFVQASSGGYRWLYESDACRAEEIFKEHPIVEKHGEYTEEEIIEEAKKYKTKKEFMEHSPNYYCAAVRYKLLEKLPCEKSLNPYKDNLISVYAYEFPETHSVYVGVTDNKVRRRWAHKNKEESAVFKHAKENNIPIRDPKYLADGLTPEEGLVEEDNYVKWYRENGWNILNRARTGRNSGSLGALKKISNKRIKEIASKYKYMREFATENKSAYSIAVSRGILKELGLEYKNTPHGTYTEEYCYNMAAKYKDKSTFRKECESLYSTAVQNGWIKQYWWLLDKRDRSVIAFNGFKILVFKDISAAAKSFGCKKGTVYQRLKQHYAVEGWKLKYLDKVEPDAKLNIPDFEHRLVV